MIRSSSSTSSGARPCSSSAIERRWISASRARPASSSGASRTSSSSCLIIEPIRITLAGCSTRSAGLVAPSSSPSRSETPMPSCVTTTKRCWSGSASGRGCGAPEGVLMRPILPTARRPAHARSTAGRPARAVRDARLAQGPGGPRPGVGQRGAIRALSTSRLSSKRSACFSRSSISSASSVRACSPSADEALELEDLPEPQHRRDDVVAVLADVVDAGDGHLDRLALEPGDVGAGHLERLDHVGDRAHRLVRGDLRAPRSAGCGRRSCAGSRPPRCGPSSWSAIGSSVNLPVLRCETRVASSWKET